jgi:cystathionine gamma-synthase
MKISKRTYTAQALGWVDEATRSIAPPIYPSTTYERNADLSYESGRKYTRADNPTYDQVSRLLAKLEDGFDAQLFASGMSAIVTVFQSLRPGDHVVAPESVYCGVRTWLTEYAEPWGLEYDFVPNGDEVALRESLRPNQTKVVWVETPSNPDWRVTDIAAFSHEAHEAGALVVVDNTVATPVLTRPISLGADLVVHSGTKYLNGHGDVLIGALIAKDETPLWRRIREMAHDAGALPGPFEAWLLLRGVRTLFLRMDQICSNALKIASHFVGHPCVDAVHYPGLPGSPDHEIAGRQMSGGFGGMISIRIAGGYESAVAVQAACRVFKRATSLGTLESLVEHRASYEGAGSPVPDNLLRLSIGVEDVADLISDLEQALEAA